MQRRKIKIRYSNQEFILVGLKLFMNYLNRIHIYHITEILYRSIKGSIFTMNTNYRRLLYIPRQLLCFLLCRYAVGIHSIHWSSMRQEQKRFVGKKYFRILVKLSSWPLRKGENNKCRVLLLLCHFAATIEW